MKTGEAVMELSRRGFRFRLDGDAVKVRFEGKETPDQALTDPMLALLRQYKEEVVYFLKYHCPKCGGVATCPDYEGRPLCLSCDWQTMVELYPALRMQH